MALWLKPPGEAHMNAEDRRYGAEFHAASQRIGADIATNRVATFRQLWGKCREWRVAQFDLAQSANRLRECETVAGPSEMRIAFSQLREDDCETPIAGVYNCLHARILTAAGDDRYNRDGERIRRVVQQTVTLNDEVRPLTEVFAYANNRGEATPRQRVPWAVLLYGGMRHTRVQHLESLDRRVETLFAQTLIPANTSPAQRLNRLAEMHWLLAHAMPDYRGSAAKSELAIRSMAMALDMELPPFREHIAPDLEAFVTPLDEFISKYASEFFETESTMRERQTLQVDGDLSAAPQHVATCDETVSAA